MLTRRRWNGLLALVLFVGLGWIWVNRIPDAGAAPARPLPPAPAVGHPAPEIALAALDGTPFILSDLRGKPVVLNFWATWCPPCRAELPELQAASVRLADQVEFVGVNQAETRAQVEAFAAEFGLTFEVPLDTLAEASHTYGVRSLPTTFFIDRQGVVRRITIGPLTEATLAQTLRSIYP